MNSQVSTIFTKSHFYNSRLCASLIVQQCNMLEIKIIRYYWGADPVTEYMFQVLLGADPVTNISTIVAFKAVQVSA